MRERKNAMSAVTQGYDSNTWTIILTGMMPNKQHIRYC